MPPILVKESTKTAVVLIGYTRFDLFTEYWHDDLFRNRKVYVFVDGPRSLNVEKEQTKFIHLVQNDWEVIRQVENLGLKRHIEFAFNFIVTKVSRIIVLEDDIKIAPASLDWVDSNVINGKEHYLSLFNPVNRTNGYANRLGYIWGWVLESWMWKEYSKYRKTVNNIGVGQVFSELNNKLNIGLALYFTPMIYLSLNDKNNSWAYGFLYWRLNNNILALMPYSSLSENIGFRDVRATHTKSSNKLEKVKLSYVDGGPVNYQIEHLSMTTYLGVSKLRILTRIIYNWFRLIFI